MNKRMFGFGVLSVLTLTGLGEVSHKAPWARPPSETGGIRGYSLDISRDKVPKMETLFRIVDILAALKYNFLSLYCEHTFAYKKHSAVWEEASPMTSEQVRALDDYCYERGIELGPDQQTFGHMEKWLKHPEYNYLAEMPQGGAELDAWWEPEGKLVFGSPTCLCPTDPRSVEFIAGLLDELLPCYRSRFINVHCDETVELYDVRRPMPGRSAVEIEKKGATAVYLDYFDKINALCAARGCTVRYAADIILKHPEVVGRLPKNAVCGIWEYEADANDYFMKNTPIVKATGVRYSMCCGTGCWCSLFGRTANMMQNVDNLCEAFEKFGAYGVFISDWGDGGHPQPWLSSVPALVYFSHRIRGEEMSREQLVAAVDALLGCRVGAALLAYGDLSAKIGGRMNGGSELYWILSDGKGWRPNVGVKDTKRFVTEQSKAAMLEYGHYAKTLADLRDAPEWVKDDFALIDLLFRAVEVRMKEPGKRNFKACFEPEYRRLWRKSNRVGGLTDSVEIIFGKR